VFGSAAALATALIVASQVGARDTRPPAPRTQQVSLFAGIPQHGPTLGAARAPVTLVEYADLQCPYCAAWARDALPIVVSDYVRTGRVRIVFRGLAFLGADSELALRMVVAAGRQNKQWNLLDELYRRQGYENSGWVSDQLDGAAAATGLRMSQLDRDAWSRATTRTIAAGARTAQNVGVQGTPSYQVGPTGGSLRLVRPDSLDPAGIRPALDSALAR
jgi:protein-disulfide isomerase